MTPTRFCFFCLLFLLAGSVHAQTNPVNRDSLLQTLKALPNDTNHVNSLLRLDKFYSANQQYDSSIYYGKKALDLATLIKWDKGIGVSNLDLAVDYWYMGNYTDALNMNYTALGIFQRIGDRKGESQAYNNMGITYASQSNYQKALECYLTTLTIKKELNDQKAMGSTLINIGSAYDHLKEYDKAFIYYREALVLKRSIGDERGQGICLLNIGQVHHNLGNMDSAMYYYNESLSLRRRIKDKRGIASSLTSLGKANIDLGHFDEAEKCLLEADSMARSLGTIDLSQAIWEQLTTLYDTTGRYKDALHAYRMYSELSDSIDLEEANRNADKLELNYQFEKERIAMQKDQEKKDALADEADKRNLIFIFAISAVLIIVSVFSVFLFTRLKIIRKQKSIIEEQKVVVEEKSREVTDSITYARRIQYTLLAHDSILQKNLPEHFVFFQPKDIVSGDFYWATEQDDRFYLAVCDSTGHGVPGAFMSLLNISFLNEAITEKKITQPGEILDFVRTKLIHHISQEGAQDGMDGVLLCIDRKANTLTYAAANCSPVIVGHHGTVVCDSDRMPVGKGERYDSFAQHSLSLTKGDMLYLFTDGFADQFGGERGKKFRFSQLKDLLSRISGRTMANQRAQLEVEFTKWKGELEQVDDVCLIGIRF